VAEDFGEKNGCGWGYLYVSLACLLACLLDSLPYDSDVARRQLDSSTTHWLWNWIGIVEESCNQALKKYDDEECDDDVDYGCRCGCVCVCRVGD
jgi:hypothetical protein